MDYGVPTENVPRHYGKADPNEHPTGGRKNPGGHREGDEAEIVGEVKFAYQQVGGGGEEAGRPHDDRHRYQVTLVNGPFDANRDPRADYRKHGDGHFHGKGDDSFVVAGKGGNY